MIEMRIDVDDDRRWFLPGETISGRAVWRFDAPPDAVEIRLFWHTSGKGTEDVEIVHRVRFDDGSPHGEREFSFTIPAGPYSFSGSLITLSWGLELVRLPDGDAKLVDVVVAPTPVEVRLDSLDRAPRGFSLQMGGSKP